MRAGESLAADASPAGNTGKAERTLADGRISVPAKRVGDEFGRMTASVTRPAMQLMCQHALISYRQASGKKGTVRHMLFQRLCWQAESVGRRRKPSLVLPYPFSRQSWSKAGPVGTNARGQASKANCKIQVGQFCKASWICTAPSGWICIYAWLWRQVTASTASVEALWSQD